MNPHHLLYTWVVILLSSVASTGAFVQSNRRSRQQRSVQVHGSEPSLPNFCADCGKAAMELRVPPGDERQRACCAACGRIEYSNPKVVVSCVVMTDDERTLLAKRAIEPRKGTWGIPQGFMEHGETTREAAVREVMEETGVVLNVGDLKFRAVYNVPGSVQLVYEARVAQDTVEQQMSESTLESSEISFVSIKSIPYEDLCFPTVGWALDHCLASRDDNDRVHIQQRTKYYDEEADAWSEFEDDPPS